MLVGEVVYLAVTALENNDIEPGEFDHVVVDEYQNLTAAEQELVEQIWSRAGSLVVMGDNDQSIYSFRFNHPEGIQEFVTRWSGDPLDDLTFGENRRCGENILVLANQMMAEAGSTKPPMIAASNRAGVVALVQWPTLDEEIHGLASYINARPDESFLVLVPRRFIGYRLRDAIGDDAITAFTEEALEHPIAQERFALASALANPDDRVAVRAWLGFHGERPEQGARRNADAYCSLPTALPAPEMVELVADEAIKPSGNGAKSVQRRCKLLVEWIDKIDESGLEDTLDSIFDPSCVSAEQDAEQRSRLTANLELLRLAARDIRNGMLEPTLDKVINTLRYRIATRASLLPDDDADAPRVRIMTLHSAKGLEADNVVLAGVSDQVLPGETDDADKLAEQQRLVYVAVTRVKENLVISWHRRLKFADAVKNHVRRDQVVSDNGETYAKSSRSRLLPQGLGPATPGAEWLTAGTE